MRAYHYTEVPAEKAEEGAKDTTVRWVISQRQGAPNFAMRVFEVGPGGHTPQHEHPWEHEIFVLAGRGRVKAGETEQDLTEGCVVYVAPGERHQFLAGAEGMRMICCVPHPKDE